MSEPDRSQQYKSFIILADIPIFVVVGTIVGYYFLGGLVSGSAALGALLGSISFFILALIPVIKLALQEHNADKKYYTTKEKEIKENKEVVKNSLFTSKKD